MKRILTREDKTRIMEALVLGTKEGCGPFDGGCLALARAFEKLGGEVAVLADRDDRAQHAVARFGRWLVDFNGAFSENDMLEFFSKSELVCVSSVRALRGGDLDEAYQHAALVDAIEDGITEGSRQRLAELVRPRKTPGRRP